MRAGDGIAAAIGSARRRSKRGRSVGRTMQECDGRKGAHPGAQGSETNIDPVAGVADHREGRQQIPDTAPRRRRHPSTSHHGSREHDIDGVGCGGGDEDARRDERVDLKRQHDRSLPG